MRERKKKRKGKRTIRREGCGGNLRDQRGERGLQDGQIFTPCAVHVESVKKEKGRKWERRPQNAMLRVFRVARSRRRGNAVRP